MKRLGGTDATKIDVFLFIAKDFMRKVCGKVDKLTSEQVICFASTSLTRQAFNDML